MQVHTKSQKFMTSNHNSRHTVSVMLVFGLVFKKSFLPFIMAMKAEPVASTSDVEVPFC